MTHWLYLTALLLLATLAFTVKSEDLDPDALPKDLSDPVLFCEGCYGVMHEINFFMETHTDQKLIPRIQNALDEVCHTDHLRKYVFSPPKMSKVCKAMVSRYRSSLEKFLREKYSGGQVVEDPFDLVEDFCVSGGTKSCDNMKIPSVERKRSRLELAKHKKEEEKAKKNHRGNDEL